ncbi:hypothetical protein TRFO_36944 [Tritrichomonas foetus]|uniref:Uncharacterized protein n=1 Tax=Tritrichomonas foetus TaxID=1144522 RepID=A0A1J4JC64_9EUKA|nr:hypothetical protein TRFO_36944 [Tritrichomonas foetus]|eukprot:OHS96794.1 hypothetical protein TRFO_36944 [Tritrichomonas foetus]
MSQYLTVTRLNTNPSIHPQFKLENKKIAQDGTPNFFAQTISKDHFHQSDVIFPKLVSHDPIRHRNRKKNISSSLNPTKVTKPRNSFLDVLSASEKAFENSQKIRIRRTTRNYEILQSYTDQMNRFELHHPVTRYSTRKPVKGFEKTCEQGIVEAVAEIRRNRQDHNFQFLC